MIDDFMKSANFIAPPRLQVSYGEFLGLKVVVQALVAAIASVAEANGGDTHTAINALSIACQESLMNASGLSDGLRDSALNQVNQILSSVGFPPSGEVTN